MVFLIFLFFVLSCDSPQKKEKPSEEVSTKELFRLKGCTHCHDTKMRLAGPSFFEISERYEDEGTLLKSLREGSCSRWKARMECMPPQRVEEQEAKRMIEWILHLKTRKPPEPSS